MFFYKMNQLCIKNFLFCLSLATQGFSAGKEALTLPEVRHLSNGLAVITRRIPTTPQVSVQLFYHVGSKDEQSKEKGKAHLIEHMLFKGTKELLSESDYRAVAHKLSAYINAFTSQDYTAYIFEVSSHTWKETFAILADTMCNARFEEQMLNSELKTVIQELKMNKDDYTNTLMYAMLASIFIDHPYHYPILGFKQDLWNLNRDDLFAFYKKHYVPNNAALVVVGDIDPEEVYKQAKKAFGHIPKDSVYKKEEQYRQKDIVNQTVLLKRDVAQPLGMCMFVFPGAKENIVYYTEILEAIFCKGNNCPV